MRGSRNRHIRGKKWCTGCEQHKPANLDYFYRESRRWDGLSFNCRVCGLIKAKNYNKNLSKAKKARKREYTKARVKELRQLVLEHYGGSPPSCSCCGESRVEFLVIDHIVGGGHKHRKKIGKTGVGFYWWLKREGFPSGFRILCHNCNMARGCYGYCPHDRESGHELIALKRQDARFSRTKGVRYERR